MAQLEEQKASIEKELAMAKVMAEATTDTKQIIPFLRSFLTSGNAEKILIDLVQYVKLTRKKDGSFSVQIRYNYNPQTPTPPTSGKSGGSFLTSMVEMRGVEPLSENIGKQISPSAGVIHLFRASRA